MNEYKLILYYYGDRPVSHTIQHKAETDKNALEWAEKQIASILASKSEMADFNDFQFVRTTKTDLTSLLK